MRGLQSPAPPRPQQTPQIAANCGRAAAAECRSAMIREAASKNLPLPLSVCCARPSPLAGRCYMSHPSQMEAVRTAGNDSPPLPTGGLKRLFARRSSVSFSASSVGVPAGRVGAGVPAADSPCWLSRCDPQQHRRPFNPPRRMREVDRQAACLFLQAACVCASFLSRLVSHWEEEPPEPQGEVLAVIKVLETPDFSVGGRAPVFAASSRSGFTPN